MDGLERWASGTNTFETARTAKGFNLSEILLATVVSRGGNWIWDTAEDFDFQEVKYLDGHGSYHDDVSGNRLDSGAVVTGGVGFHSKLQRVCSCASGGMLERDRQGADKHKVD